MDFPPGFDYCSKIIKSSQTELNRNRTIWTGRYYIFAFKSKIFTINNILNHIASNITINLYSKK